MGWELLKEIMERGTKVNGKIITLMDMELIISKAVMFIAEIGWTVQNTDKVK